MRLRYLPIVAALATGCGKCTSDGSGAGAPAPSASTSAEATSAVEAVDAGVRRVRVLSGARGPIKTMPTIVLPADSANRPKTLPPK